MILSASRRTDLPNYYPDWFYERIKEGSLCVRNPFRPHQVSKIDLSPEIVDCIVFWTKNPENMLPRLNELDAYKYYFQFTLTGYGRDIEPGIPHKRKHMLSVFRTLSNKIGPDRVIWRYDPILSNETYTLSYHQKAFREIARSLQGYTHKVTISFVDHYAKTKHNMEQLKTRPFSREMILHLASYMAETAAACGMEIVSCAEQIDLQEAGIKHGSCIDKKLLEQITGFQLTGSKDKNQRKECGCLESIDVGTYDTCPSGCRYCYASSGDRRPRSSWRSYDVHSPLLCSTITEHDQITEKTLRSLKIEQLSLFQNI